MRLPESCPRLDNELWGDGRLSYRSIHEYADARPDQGACDIAAQLVQELDESTIRTFARAYVEEQVESHRRVLARAIEEAAEKAVAVLPLATAQASAKGEPWHGAFDEVQANPLETFINGAARKKFRKWMGERFDAWHAEWSARLEGDDYDDDQRDRFAADWHPEGVFAFFRDRRADAVLVLIEHERQRIRLELTAELLGSSFALGDGRRVTWGAATIDEHEQRVALLVRNAAGNVETAARHAAAIDMLRAGHASTLRELAGREVIA